MLSFFLVVDLDPTTLRTPSATTFPSGTDSWGAKILFLSIFGYDLISGISSLQKKYAVWSRSHSYVEVVFFLENRIQAEKKKKV